MMRSIQLIWLGLLAVLGGCQSAPQDPVELEPGAELALAVPVAPPAAPALKTHTPSARLTADGYKREVASRIAQASAANIADELPQMLKSVVVVNVTIDRNGNLAHVSV